MGNNSTTSYYGASYTPTTKDFLTDKRKGGLGLAFPLGIRRNTGGFFSNSTGISKVRMALHQLLLTERGERIMLPKFGCNLKKFLFQPLDQNTFNAIKEEILHSCHNYLQGAEVRKISILSGGDVGSVGTSKLQVILLLQMNDLEQTIFTEEITVQ
tara:strand:+ start:80 stop:547 length:468 start_codon:yes stop_codon:yes gene_type:complete